MNADASHSISQEGYTHRIRRHFMGDSFARNGLRVIIGLFVIAALAPFLANSHAIIRVADGRVTFPVFPSMEPIEWRFLLYVPLAGIVYFFRARFLRHLGVHLLFVLGIIAAIAVNGDSVAVIERLSTSKTLSGAVSGAAIQFAQSPNGEHAGADHPSSAQQSLQDTLVTLDKLGLPIGWTGPGDDNTFLLKNKNERIPAAALRLLEVHWVGWLITGLAVSFGAPFWFDLLSRFITVRSTIKPQDKTKT